VAHPFVWVCKSARRGLPNSGQNGVSYSLTPGYGRSTEGPSNPGAVGELGWLDNGESILKTRLVIASLLGFAILRSGEAAYLSAQNKPAETQPGVEKLSEEARRGEGLFLQRCSLCHLPRKLKFGSPPVIGPTLSGQFKDATPDQMKILRGFILKGGPDMPGFQYGLEPKEIDDLIAYLKTL
jgi:mono/diheme cytochrome c family protein